MRDNDFVVGTEEPDSRPCQRPFVILVTGIPASGKSMLAERLSADLGLPWFSKDRIKEELYDTIGFASREEGAAPSPSITLEQYIAPILESFCC